jgi:hypothetical protein
MLVRLKGISTALVLGLGVAAPTLSHAQSPMLTPNQATADAVAGSLRASRGLSGYRIEIEARDGLVTLSGSVRTQAQKSEALARAQSVAGVAGVIDQIQVTHDRGVRPVQYQTAFGGHGGLGGGVIYDGAPGMMGSATGPGMMGSATGPATMDPGPVPEGPAGMAGGTQVATPGAPNYAWPSYAPYPNFSAVGYPTAYPWQAWPNIGPPYPYPEVPLDWRAVTLRWDDGIWWLDFKKNYTRPFFTPYPFGIFAY